MKLLIVEDNQDLRQLYASLFTKAGHTVRSRGNGLNAITEAVDFQPNCVLLDILMPEMNGYEFLQTITTNTSMNPVVIVCSNLTQQTDIARAMQEGADAYLNKSEYIGEELVKAVESEYDMAVQKRQIAPPAQTDIYQPED